MRERPIADDSSSSNEARIEDLLTELLELPPALRTAALATIAREHPNRARTLARRIELLATGGIADDDLDGEPAEDLQFGRFALLHRLGGGLTDVYLARDPRRDDPVVLKLLRLPGIQSKAMRHSLLREAMAAATIAHPCIGKVLETGEVEGTPYLLCPHVPSMTLATWIRRQQERQRRVGAEELRLIATWLGDVADALAAAHAAGLVHRDVKPANILIPLQGRAQIIDFGLCQSVDPAADSESTPLAGTLAYMSPELLSPHERPIGPAADIYALGVTLFECVALRLPFAADTRGQLSRMILRSRLPDVRRHGVRLPRGIQRLVASATARVASDRYPSATAMAADLDRLRRGQRVRGAGPNNAQRLARWLGTHRLLAASLLALATALSVAATLMVLTHRARREAAATLALLGLPARIRAAEARADLLVPGWPDQIDALRTWLRDDGEPLARLLPQCDAKLDAERRSPHADPSVLATLECARAALAAFAAEPRGTVAMVRSRLAWATVVQVRTIDDHAEAWAATRAQIAADPRYHALDLPPQLDLIPLGRDPTSGLFEFYHPRSGGEHAEVPVRIGTDRHLLRSDTTGLVFVLVPGGTFWMGHQSADAQRPRYEPRAGTYAQPQEVALDAFFLSKYEMTQGQWWLVTGERPSAVVVGGRTAEGLATYLFPVEQVSATECDRVLASIGLMLPTEAQWEYAAGCGAPTMWSFGDDVARLGRYANVCDRRYPDPRLWRFDFDDGFAGAAPVGQLAANAFGLHDCIGNVQEWCRDTFADYADFPARAGDGFRVASTDARARRIVRGGAFTSSGYVGTSFRRDELPDRRGATLGLRPARAVLREAR